MSQFQMPITINQAMTYIENNYYLLPAFQRDFVWKAEQIEKLFDSLMRGYPTSSMLFWKVKGDTKTKWKFYKFIKSFICNAADKTTVNELYSTNNSNDFFAILDGQQRLTAMRIGLYGDYAYHERYNSWSYSPTSFPARTMYLNVSQLGGINDDCQYFFEFKKNSETLLQDFYVDKSNDILWFRVGAIIKYHNSGEEISDYFSSVNLTKNQRTIIKRLDNTIFNDNAITYYEEDEQNPDKAVKIFTRINSGGTYLDFADIVFSLMVANWDKKDAKTEIKALIENVAKKSFDIDKNYIVKAFLYLYHKNVKTEINSFTTEFCKIIEDNWENIRDAINSLFDLLRSFGLNSVSLTSNNSTLPILYYIYHKNIYNDFTNKIQYKADRENIKTWLFSAILRKQFGRSGDAVLQQSRKAYTDNTEKFYIDDAVTFDGKLINNNISGYSDITDEILEEILSTQKDDRYAFPILSLLYPHLDYKNNDFHKDHLHAENLYDTLSDELKNKIPFKVYNSIINLQMLDKNENESKGQKSLIEWVNQSCSDSDTRERFLCLHIIPNVDLSLSNIEEFFEKRKELLKEKLKSLLN